MSRDQLKTIISNSIWTSLKSISIQFPLNIQDWVGQPPFQLEVMFLYEKYSSNEMHKSHFRVDALLWRFYRDDSKQQNYDLPTAQNQS